MCAAAGFDFAFIDGEHGSGEALELEHHVRAAESFGMPAVVRIASHQPSEILRALDIGAEGIIIPHVNTWAEAEAVVKAAHYPPIGRRGLATTTRAGRHAFCGLGYPGESTHPVVVEAFNWICSAVASKPNVKLGAFARDAKDGHAWIGKGASCSPSVHPTNCSKVSRSN